MFQEKLGSMLDKVERVRKSAPELAELLGLDAAQRATLERAAVLFKSDLATKLVVELTSLQGIMGREYALLSGEDPAVAKQSTSIICRGRRATACLRRWVGAGDRQPAG